MTISELLTSLTAPEISDIFLRSDQIPVVRRCGVIVQLTDCAPVPGAELVAFRERVLSERQQQLYRQKGSADATTVLSNDQRFRLNFLSSFSGDALAVRPIRPAAELNLAALGLPEQLHNWIGQPRGIILFCGSTGSGKSTTLAALVNLLNQTHNYHIITIEDPIEFVHLSQRALITQREVGCHTASFATAIRDAMRENPDVIVIGEMRDRETMQVAIDAALTGHLVLGTLHTADAVQAIERIINLFPDELRQQLALDLGTALIGIAAQRLIPTVDGRQTVAVETLPATPLVRKLIGERDFVELEKQLKSGTAPGTGNFTRAVFELYRAGKIDYEHAEAQASSREEFILLGQGMENGIDTFRNCYGEKAAPDDDLIDIGTLLYSAVRQQASDLILTVNTSPSIRIDGTIHALDLPELTAEDVGKLLYGIITPHQRIVFEEQRELDFALSIALHGKNSDQTINQRFRINAFHQRGAIGLVARVINATVPRPETLHLPPILNELIARKQGLILITGPTGSGKSTTLASLIDQINRHQSCHIITIEDPIEYVHENRQSIVEQREVNSDTHDFATALKHALRQDPDVIMVGEMRDVPTMAAALTAAETGHLVLATIHTNNAAQTIDRIVDSFPNQQQNQIKLQLAAVLLGVVSQRLLPRKSGSGRIPAFEIMVGTPPIKALIREGKTHMLNSSIETGFKDGMVTLDRALDKLYENDEVTLEEIQSLKLASDLK